MKLKAQNTLELISLVVVVAVVAVAAFMFMTGKTDSISKLSKINSNEASVQYSNDADGSAVEGFAINRKSNTETAGSLSNIVATMSSGELTTALSSQSVNKITTTTSSDNKNIVTLANELISQYNLPVSSVTASDADLVEKLVAVSESAKEKASDSTIYKNYTLLLAKIIN